MFLNKENQYIVLPFTILILIMCGCISNLQGGCFMKKAITFSFDDGVTQDIRLISLLDKYNLKSTFNLNSGTLGQSGVVRCLDKSASHQKVRADEVKDIYKDHEIACHTLNHIPLVTLNDDEIIFQVEEDRKNLEKLCGYPVVGMAYPGSSKLKVPNNNLSVAKIIQNNTSIKYVRNSIATHNFNLQSWLFQFQPTVHTFDFDNMEELGRKFLELEPQEPKVFYIFGHSYEFDCFNTWERLERFFDMISNKDDILYATNRDIILKKWYE